MLVTVDAHHAADDYESKVSFRFGKGGHQIHDQIEYAHHVASRGGIHSAYSTVQALGASEV